jgi:ribosomal protein S18 acetylase RimI-like enzyme
VSVTVRRGTPADAAFVDALGRETVMSSVAACRHAAEPVVHLAFERLIETIESQAHVTLIAEDDGAFAGFALVLDNLPDEVTGAPQSFVAYMAVDPQRRRRGIGSALLHAAEDEAKRRGLPYMALMVTEDNAEARALYERAGYRTERRLLCKAL